MRPEPIQVEKVGKYTIKIFQDEDAESPRNHSNLGHMICWHRQAELGDETVSAYPPDDDYSDESIVGEQLCDRWRKYLHNTKKARVVLPLYLYDHSGMTMRVEPFGDRWDSGQVGWIYDTPEGVKECWGDKVPTDDELIAALLSEVATYDTWLTGGVVGYVIEDDNGNHIDSCWGHYGVVDALEQAKAALPPEDPHRERRIKLLVEDVMTWPFDRLVQVCREELIQHLTKMPDAEVIAAYKEEGYDEDDL